MCIQCKNNLNLNQLVQLCVDVSDYGITAVHLTAPVLQLLQHGRALVQEVCADYLTKHPRRRAQLLVHGKAQALVPDISVVRCIVQNTYTYARRK